MLQVLSKNDIVRVEDANCWDRKAVVLEEVNPRSYVVRTENGQILRRNRKSLLETQESLYYLFNEHHSVECSPPDGIWCS